MKRNTDFADLCEKNGYERLKDFNSYLHLKNLAKFEKGKYKDASGVTTTGQLVNVEHKIRNQTILFDDNNNPYLVGVARETKRNYTAHTIYIEGHKAADLYFDYHALDFLPLYINYLNDGYVVVFNLTKLKYRPEKEHQRIWSELYQSFEIADREHLRLEDAWIYQRENNCYKLIYKP